MLEEFKAFLTKSNAIALALGFIIGAATGKVVTALVADVLMPIIGIILPAGDWRSAEHVLSTATDAAGKVTVNSIKYGDLLGSLVDFFFIALVVFLLTKALIKPPPPGAPTRECPECLETIPSAAKRCKACTATVTPA